VSITEVRSVLDDGKRERPDGAVLSIEVDDGVPDEQWVIAADQAEAAGFLHPHHRRNGLRDARCPFPADALCTRARVGRALVSTFGAPSRR
jgi:hypothetical protein